MNKSASFTASKSRLNMTMYVDIDRAPRKNWLVQNFLGEGELSCAFGPPGSGKSVLAGDLAAHVAAGRAWFGRRVMRGAVLYVAAERVKLVKLRLAAFRLHHEIEDLPLAIISGAVDLRNSQADADTIIMYANRLRDHSGQELRLIQIDTVSRVLAGGDENSSKDIGALITNLARIQDATGAHVQAIHHVPHDAQRMRGHGALLAACDSTVHVEKSGGVRIATLDKTNDGPEGEKVVFELQSVELYRDEETGEATTAPIVILAKGETTNPKEKTVRMPKAAQIALRALREAIDELGQIPPASNHIPAGVRVVTEVQWREYSYRRGISGGEVRAKQQAFKRSWDTLIGNQQVVVWGDHVWPTGP